ncbi:MAG: phosphoglucosamine mutase [Planctomycetaceae bacterium]|jgi:phosphomannomutase|nr:phosphoglucosamine mutase [Planctomycetaceae bacterium]
MSELIISVSGLRGVVGETLTLDAAMRYVLAFSASTPCGTFIVTRDSRPSGMMFADVIHASLNAVGRSTIDAEITATPTTGILIRQFGAVGGIQISASHNPIEFNGIKLFSGEGRVLPQRCGAEILEYYRNGQPTWVPHDQTGTRTLCKNTILEHRKAVIQTVDVEAIIRRKFKVLLDVNHGAGGILGDWLLEELGCEITMIGNKPDGQFLHTPEPTAENLVDVCRRVKEAKVDVAFCQDPDADRVAIIDANGRYVGEEYTITLCLEHLLRIAEHSNHPCPRKKGAVVINCATSRMNEDVAKKYGAPIFRSAVGEANVVDLMLEKKAMFGGEGNGGPIDPEVGLVRDSFVGMALVLDAMAATGKTVAQLVDELPHYALVKRKTRVELDEVPAILDKTATIFRHLPCNRLDGLRIDHGDAWALLRGSNTEPIIRIFAEAPTENHANRLCDEIEQIVADSLK